MDFCNRITNQYAIYHAQSRGLEIVLPCSSPKKRKSSSTHSTTKDWVLRAFYSRAKTADINSPLSVATQLPKDTNHATDEKDHKPAKAVEANPMLPAEPAVKFKQARIDSAAEKLKFSLVGKFSRPRPSLKQIKKWAAARLRLAGRCRISLLDRDHVLIRLDNEEDMHSIWLRNRWFVGGSLVKVFRWTSDFRPSDGEPSSAPVWVSLPSLPVVYFDRGLLYDIASLLGRVLSMDAPTRKLSRTDRARVCVELDLLRQEHPHRVWIGVEDKGFWQVVKYEKLPSYCTSCRAQGHSVEACSNLKESISASQRTLPNLAVQESNVVAKEAKSNLRKLNVEKHCQTCPTILEMNKEDKLVMDVLSRRKFDSLVCMKQVIEGKGEGGRELINSPHPMLQDQQRFLSTVKLRKDVNRNDGSEMGCSSGENIGRTKEKQSVQGIQHKDKALLQEEMKEEEEVVDIVEEGKATEKVDVVDLEFAGGHVEDEQVIRNYLLSRYPSSSRKRKTIFFWKKKRQAVELVEDMEEDPQLSRFNAKRFQLRELLIATDGFANRNILGRGGFGRTYKGRLADGSLVAVKRAREEKMSAGIELQFRTEVEHLSIALHKNILPLIGFCMSRTERLLVYPYMANGDIGNRLRARPLDVPPLHWSSRMRIAVGTAKGLAYLHEQMNIKIIHRDVKAANILLNDEFEAVISDFGLSKRMNLEDSFVTSDVRGTLGHIAPEYLCTGQVSEKTDVFGYGILLLELITGQRAFDLARLANDDGCMLLDWVMKNIVEEKVLGKIIDPDLKDIYVEAEVEQLILVSILCTNVSPVERPKMSEVVRLLGGYGLAERWERWQKTGVDQINSDLPSEHAGGSYDSTGDLRPEELSSCR